MNKKRNKLAAFGGVVCMALAVLLGPVSSLPTQAAASHEETVMPMRDAIGYMYEVRDNKLYKRLYNHSTCNWVGDWIYVRDVPEGWTLPGAR